MRNMLVLADRTNAMKYHVFICSSRCGQDLAYDVAEAQGVAEAQADDSNGHVVLAKNAR